MLEALCATLIHNAVDLIAVGGLAVFAIIATKKGFINCFFSFISTIVAIFVAFLFMNTFLRITGGLFGIRKLLEIGCTKAFENVNGFNIDISNQGLEAALADKSLPQFLINTVIAEFGNANLEPGTTIAMLVGSTLGGFIASLLAWGILFLAVKLLSRVVRKLLTSVIEKIPLIGALNHLLGFFIGVIQGILVVSIVIGFLSILPIEGVTAFFDNCIFVGWLYHYNPLTLILSLIFV